MSTGGNAGARRKPVRPDFNHLETFIRVAQTRNFAEAARQMGVSQPAVSQTIAKLEDIYGGDLFERRKGAPVSLTPIGKAILPKARLLLFTVDQQIEQALATAQSLADKLTIGFHTGLAYGPLSSGIAHLRRSRPDVDLRIVEASPGDLYRQLGERALDVMFTAFLGEVVSSANEQERLWDEPFMVAVPDTHPLSNRESLRWSDLSGLPIILRSHGGDLSAYRALAARMGDRPFHCDLHDVSRGALIEMVRLGLGTAMSLRSAAVPREGVAFLPIEDENALAGVDAVWSRDDRNPLRHHFLSVVRSKVLP